MFAAMLLGSSLLAAGAQAQTETKARSLVAQAQPPVPPMIQMAQARRAPGLPRPESPEKTRINAWTIGLAAGRTEGAPLQFASELARVLDDGDNMRILPIVTRGPFDNVYDLLYLRGVDAAIIYGDVLDHFKSKPEFAAAAGRINYLLNLFPSEVHVFVRPEIRSLQDLAGKVVNFNTEGTAAAFSGPIVFRRLGVEVKQTFMPHGVAMEKMRQSDEVAATFWVSSKPLAPFLKGKWPEGFKFLPIEYSDKLEYYAPAYLEASDYPNLIKQGERVATISVPAVLAVYAWHKDHERYRRIVRMIDYLFDRFERLQKEPGYHEKWKDVNLAATVPGWTRFPRCRTGLITSQPDQHQTAAAPTLVATATLQLLGKCARGPRVKGVANGEPPMWSHVKATPPFRCAHTAARRGVPNIPLLIPRSGTWPNSTKTTNSNAAAPPHFVGGPQRSALGTVITSTRLPSRSRIKAA
jgi:TRAP-type uncharacterized transport system substrate-binding protein